VAVLKGSDEGGGPDRDLRKKIPGRTGQFGHKLKSVNYSSRRAECPGRQRESRGDGTQITKNKKMPGGKGKMGTDSVSPGDCR